ncbi:hypothetical protein GCM10010508_63560 [Streptomyces naganishii JCM 4654]|uniref:Uncharacterized protein n=1 Tax=Streptomyces naganishii JCM 4654 TaxID=1306179 RepID=A0A918YAQ4_9ACTN|nr:hypothetical protein GCM10010508_63560 [Streptomyces naganishii JCM 4654]
MRSYSLRAVTAWQPPRQRRVMQAQAPAWSAFRNDCSIQPREALPSPPLKPAVPDADAEDRLADKTMTQLTLA